MSCTLSKKKKPTPLLKQKSNVISFPFSTPRKIGAGGIYLDEPALGPLPNTERARSAAVPTRQRATPLIDISQPVRDWIEGIAGMLFLFVGLWAFLVLTHGLAQ